MMTSEARDRFYKATCILASGTGTLKVRLREAFVPALITLREEDMPWPDLWDRFITLRQEIAPDDRPDVLLERWWDFELSRIAHEIVDIFDELVSRA